MRYQQPHPQRADKVDFGSNALPSLDNFAILYDLFGFELVLSCQIRYIFRHFVFPFIKKFILS